MGEYDEAHGIDLIGIRFRYSSLPGGSPLTITAAKYNRSIREELHWLGDKGVLRLTSLADIESLTVRFEGADTQIDCAQEKGGAATLRIQDTGLEERHVEDLKVAFHETFHVPLCQPLNPSVMVMGATEIYQYLLSGVDAHQVRDYQQEPLSQLLEWRVLKGSNVKVGKCSNVNCTNSSQHVTDPEVTKCHGCESPLKWEQHVRYTRDPKMTIKAVKDVLQRAMGWRFSSAPKRFEGYTFYRFRSKASPNKLVYVFINERMSAVKAEVFQRTMFPILVVHPSGAHRAPTIDASGIAHLGLPHALAARGDAASRLHLRKSLNDVVRRLLQMEHERVITSSRQSRYLLAAKPADYNDQTFEADVYNILRRLFPYSIKWGGPNKPDGFSSLIYFTDNDLKKPVKFNVSYDAKYSEATYPFGVGEFRQMFDYITSLGRSKFLQSENNQYDGHVIITNRMAESSMQGAADYLWTEHRLGTARRDFLLVFMMEGFLTTLYDLVHDNSVEISKRWSYLPEVVSSTIRTSDRGGYRLLTEAEAKCIVTYILGLPPVENPINHEFLLDDLSHLINLRARPKLRPVNMVPTLPQHN
jgi:hypothetical protein